MKFHLSRAVRIEKSSLKLLHTEKNCFGLFEKLWTKTILYSMIIQKSWFNTVRFPVKVRNGQCIYLLPFYWRIGTERAYNIHYHCARLKYPTSRLSTNRFCGGLFRIFFKTSYIVFSDSFEIMYARISLYNFFIFKLKFVYFMCVQVFWLGYSKATNRFYCP